MGASRQTRRVAELLDVEITNVQDEEALVWSVAQQAYINHLIVVPPLDSDLAAIADLNTTPFGRGLLELANQAALLATAGAAPAVHEHAGEDITSGTIADARLPAGIARDAEVTAAIAAAIANLINSAPGALDTLNELAAALGNDPNFATTITNLLAGKQPLDADLTSIAALATTPYGRALLTLADKAEAYTLLGVDTDPTLAANSNTRIASQAATKAYADAALVASVILAPGSSTRNVVQPTAAGFIPLIVRGFTAQSADLQQWQDNTGAVLARITAAGILSISNAADSNLFVQPTAPGVRAAVLRGHATQAAALLEAQTSAGGSLFSVMPTGAVNFIGGTTVTPTGALWLVNGSDPNLYVQPSAGSRGLIVRGSAAQSADLQQWQNSAGTVLAKITSAGVLSWGSGVSLGMSSPGYMDMSATAFFISGAMLSIGPMTFDQYGYGGWSAIGRASVANQKLTVAANAVGVVPLVVQGFAGQTAALQQWQDSAATVLGLIDAAGTLTVQRTIPAAQTNLISAKSLNTNRKISLGFDSGGGEGGIYADSTLILDPGGIIDLRPGAVAGFKLTGNSSSVATLAVSASGSSLNFQEDNDQTVKVFANLIVDRSAASNAASVVTALVKAAPAQTADIQQWQNSAGTVLAKIDSTGALTAPMYDPLGWGMARNLVPSTAPQTGTWDTANRAYFWRLTNGKKGATGIRLAVATQSGNLSFQLFRNTGVGSAGLPGTSIVATGAVACPAAGAATVSLGGTFDILPGDWLAMTCDNTTASFERTFAGIALGPSMAGVGAYKAAAHPLSGSSPTLDGAGLPGAAILAVV